MQQVCSPDWCVLQITANHAAPRKVLTLTSHLTPLTLLSQVLLATCLLPLVVADTASSYSSPLPLSPPQSLSTKPKCHLEEVELYAEVCTPTIERQCEKVVVKSHSLETREDCVDLVRTVCTEAEEEVDNELCYFVYNKESREAEATTLTVDYEVKCGEKEETTGASCPYGGCQKEKTCSNLPRVSPAKTPVMVGYPVVERKCENKPVKIPKVTCTEETVSPRIISDMKT